MEKAVGYIRVGPHEAGPGPTEEEQLNAIVSYAEQNNLEIMMVIKDIMVSGTVPLVDRLGGSDLSNIIDSTGVSNIVCHKLDRIFRNAIDADAHMNLWQDQNIVLHLVNLGGVSLRTDEMAEVKFSMIISGFAELERQMASERTRSAIALKKANRFVYGATPYGYDQEGNQLIPNVEEQETLQAVMEWHTEGWSLRKIADRLNKQNIPTKRSSSSGTPTKWYASTVRYLLANPLYSNDSDHKSD